MNIVLESSWQALKEVAFMFVTGCIMSVLTIFHFGDLSQAFNHSGWCFLSVSLHLLSILEFMAGFNQNTDKDNLNQKVGVSISLGGLVLSVLLLNLSVTATFENKAISFPYYSALLWGLISLGVFNRFMSRNILLQRKAGRVKSV
ncbi:hypothetical protein [Litorilituus sediminis]|uniref:Uncharacterized protein n=1 Tax=Litorilituus sediminis TaxID=718192 RepID=A0A4V0ZGJ6_9GAMM|nr:hypothetical protein [Litorilituus sediminis]QBG37530.1 hypothetical protein EMK97_18205 [Litorilituus sediminis]